MARTQMLTTLSTTNTILDDPCRTSLKFYFTLDNFLQGAMSKPFIVMHKTRMKVYHKKKKIKTEEKNLFGKVFELLLHMPEVMICVVAKASQLQGYKISISNIDKLIFGCECSGQMLSPLCMITHYTNDATELT